LLLRIEIGAMEPTSVAVQEALYQQALLYRDGKQAEILSVEESTIQAEKIFLQLANLGHAKAAHNYASLLVKKKNYQQACIYFEKANLVQSRNNWKKLIQQGLAKKKDLFLVVGSDRDNDLVGYPPYLRKVWGDKVDLSHVHSFDGKATTMDLKESTIPNVPHIVGDAQKFDFESFYNIKHVMLERYHTSNLKSPSISLSGPEHQGNENGRYTNALGECVEQLAKAMTHDAILEIEWDPFTCHFKINSLAMVEELSNANPFNGFFQLELYMTAVITLVAEETPPDKYDRNGEAYLHICFLMNLVRLELQLLADCGASTLDQLNEKLESEVSIFMQCSMTNQMVLVDCDIDSATIKQFNKAARNKYFIDYDMRLLLHRTSVKDKRGITHTGTVHNGQTILMNSLFQHISSCVQAKIHFQKVKAYLERIGFYEVTMERKMNDHNGRKNVFMVRALKL